MNRRRWRQLVVCACIAGATTVHAAAASAAPLVPTTLPAPLGVEAEVNDSAPVASPIMGDQRIRGALSVPGEVDYYRFTAKAGDRVFAGVVTSGSQTAPADTRLALLADAGVTVIEEDDNDGSQFPRASSIAGAVIPSDGIYYLRVDDIRGVAASPAPYDIYLALRSGPATPEGVEPENNTYGGANPLVNGEVAGRYDATGDKDWFAFKLQAGDTVFLSLDLDPERDGISFDGQLGFGLAGDVIPEKPQSILTVDDAPEPADTGFPSEAETMTVSQPGTYYAYLDVAEEKTEVGGEAATYDLAVTVFPAAQPSCRTYSSTLSSAFLDGGTTSFPIPVEDPALINRAALRLRLEDSVMADLDVSLRNPAGGEVPLFTDIGETAAGGQQQMEAVFDDFAATPPLYTSLRPLGLQTDSPLAGFKGQQAQGIWTLVVRDDTANGSAGNLKAAELVLCPQPVGDPGPPTGGGGGGSQPQPLPRPQPKPAPELSGLTIAPGKFRATKAGAMVLAKRPRGGGALVSYQSSEAVQTNFVLYELEEGRRIRRKCVRGRASNSRRKPCVRRVKVISFLRNDGAGRNRFGFSGRVGARKLPPGEYQLQARAYATSGLTSAPVAATFEVLPPAPNEASRRRG